MNFLSVFWQSITITVFVLSMMLIIDFINVSTKGLWSSNIRRSPIRQVVLATVLGLVPGCLGAYTAVSLFVHNIIGKGALVAAMIASSGDEAFFLLSLVPDTALVLAFFLFVLALLAGILVNRLTKNETGKHFPVKHFEVHKEAGEQMNYSIKNMTANIRSYSRYRVILVLVLAASIVMVALNFGHFLEDFGTNHLDHESTAHHHPLWISITFIVVLAITLFIVLSVSEHFLKEHLFGHILKKHLLRIFLWTFFTLLLIHLAGQYFEIENLIGQNLYMVLVIAVLVGIIPESGPHLVFILLYASGTIPFSILLANSIVQDGHGSLPLLAESQRNFLIVKGINVVVGLLAGTAGLLLGF